MRVADSPVKAPMHSPVSPVASSTAFTPVSSGSSTVPVVLGRDPSSVHMKKAVKFMAVCQAILIVLFAIYGGTESFPTDYFSDTDTSTRALDGYNLYVGVMIMMVIGFGYLMTFMKKFGLGAVGFCFMVTALGLQWGLLIEHFFYVWYNDEYSDVPLDMYNIYIVTAAVAVPLISFGAVIGKITPLQLLIMVVLEFFCHSILANVLLVGVLKITDIGATYGIHMFGCYFGLAVAYVFGVPESEPEGGAVSDVFSLIGTLFLWVYWPSFVGGFLEVDSSQQQHALANTILCLCGSTVATFAYSSFFNHTKFSSRLRFRPVDIQNATLAGGVAVGALANLRINPGIVILVGSACGYVSTLGYNYIQPYLCDNFGLHDTCGINNLHGMPSIIGAVASILVAGLATNDAANELYHYDQGRQALSQFYGLLVTLGFAIATGLICGYILRLFGPGEGQTLVQFHDQEWWDLVDDAAPLVVDDNMGVLEESLVPHDHTAEKSTTSKTPELAAPSQGEGEQVAEERKE